MRRRPPAPRPSRLDTILLFIRGFMAVHGYSPSIREISQACGISSTSLVNRDLDKLQDLGALTRERGKSRTIVLMEKAKD